MFVMKNYKVVGVYSGYGEMSIEGIDEVKGESFLRIMILVGVRMKMGLSGMKMEGVVLWLKGLMGVGGGFIGRISFVNEWKVF